MGNEIEFKFGDYAIIEQKRHGVPNEMFVHKVIGQLRSNTWVDVPVQSPATETLHDEMEDVCWCICCGVDETEVRAYRVKDMQRSSRSPDGGEVTALALTLEKSREASGCPAGVDLQDWVMKLAAERDAALNAERVWETAMMEVCGEDGPASVAAVINALAAEHLALKDINAWCKTDAFKNMYREFKAAEALGCSDADCMHDAMLVAIMHAPETSATDRIVAGIKADAANQMCVAFVKHKELAGLSDDDVVTVREATDAVLHCAEVISEGADK